MFRFFFLYYATGDGGNDVSMIQAAHCGIGIEGKVKVSVYLSLYIWMSKRGREA